MYQYLNDILDYIIQPFKLEAFFCVCLWSINSEVFLLFYVMDLWALSFFKIVLYGVNNFAFCSTFGEKNQQIILNLSDVVLYFKDKLKLSLLIYFT